MKQQHGLTVTYDIRDHLTPRRMTNAMWCFSWINGAFAR
jgi:hypothetical protein